MPLRRCVDFILRASWVIGYAFLMKVFILLRGIEEYRRGKKPRAN